MWGYSALAAVLALVVLGPQTADPPRPVAPVRPEDLKDNVKARLVGSEHRDDRGQTVAYKFETLGEDRKEVWFVFRRGAADTLHLRTLAAVMHGCLERGEIDKKMRLIRYKVKDGVEAIFSFPKNGTRGDAYFTDEEYDRCYLVSLKIGAKK